MILDKIKAWLLPPAAVLATIGILQLVAIGPKKRKIEKLESKIESQIVTIAARDSTIMSVRAIAEDRQHEVENLTSLHRQDSANYASRERQFQHTISRMRTENKLLATGVRVDLVTLTYRDGLFSKPKLIDSTYQTGYKWGE